MKLGYYLLPGLLLGISGCASTTPDSEVDSVHYSQWAEQQAQQNAEAAPQVAAEPVLAQLDEATPAAAENTSQASQSAAFVVSANQCWVQSVVRPKPVQKPLEVVTKDSVNKIQVTPTQLSQERKQVVTKDGVTMYKVEPPVYRQVKERVEVRPEIVRTIVEPAVFEMKKEVVEVEAARTELEACKTAGVTFARENTARTLCARLIPAKTATVMKKTLVKPETKREVVEPAVFKEVTRWVLETPARVVEVPVANETAELPVQVVAQAEKVDEQQVPAEVRQLTATEYTGEPQMVTVRAVCDADLNAPMIVSMQNALQSAGLNPGAADGKLGPRTVAALLEYQRRHGLAYGALTYESLQHLGVVQQ